MDKKRAILLKNFKGDFTKLNSEMIMQIEQAMFDYAADQIIVYQSKLITGDVKSFIYLLFHANRDNIILYMRHIMYRLAVKKARFRSKSEGYKMYVILKSEIKYQVLSTLDFKYNKTVRILDKNITAKDMEAIAALVVYPDGTTTGQGFSGLDIEMAAKPVTGTNHMQKKQRNK